MSKKSYILELISLSHIEERQKIKIYQHYTLKRRRLKILVILKDIVKQG